MHPDGEQMRQIASLMAQKKLIVKIDKIFNLDEIAEAHKAIESHSTDGKIIIRIG
jgi:NADPH:quinone reductase-like Zn-dependent oxidoreductase